ncbi:uncharacterized protein LOC121385140 [Gigantopelta aegis]|uniref:uncharacterized protein LOC121385140 n=1 Tax=Gigantopelta aegis TaxID=1735272 RepID=UPI001B88CDCA|nr:uncharacterized protein LOC121385140 [Gigantopelta aegis]
MKIKLYPAGTFSGVIYVAGEKNTTGCMFTGSSGILDLQDESCGNVTTDTATGDRSRIVIVQYNDKYITELDTKLTVTCPAAGAGTVDVTATFSSQDPDGNIKEQAITNTADIDSSAVNFEIKLKDGTSVSSSTRVPLNDQLTFEFAVLTSIMTNTVLLVSSSVDCLVIRSHMVVLSTYIHYDKHCTTVRVESCTASNGKSGADEETLKLIENSCPSSEVGKLMEQDPTPDDDFKVTFKLRPFKFNKNNAISITCTVKVCPTGSAQCQPMDCSTGNGPNRRKRRSTEISDETLRKTIIIQFPELEQTKASDTSKKTSVNDVTTPLVAGVAIVIILLLVICIVVLLFVKKRRSNRKSQDEGVNKQTI